MPASPPQNSLPTITHVLHALDYAGAEVLAADLARQTRDHYNHLFICLDKVGPLGQRLQSEGFSVVCLHRKPGIDLRAIAAMHRTLATHNVIKNGLIHAHQYGPFFYAAAARTPHRFFPRFPLHSSLRFPHHSSLRFRHRSSQRVTASTTTSSYSTSASYSPSPSYSPPTSLSPSASHFTDSPTTDSRPTTASTTDSRPTNSRPPAAPPILFTEHGREYPDHRRPKRVFANRLLLTKHDRITAVAHYVADLLVQNEGLPKDRIQVIHNAPHPYPREDHATRHRIRTDLGIPADAPVAIQIARFHPVKDHETSIRAFHHAFTTQPTPQSPPPSAFGSRPSHTNPSTSASASASTSAPHLIYVGDGPHRRPSERLVKQLKLHENVHFTGVRTDIPDLLAAADLFLLTSLSEGISVTLLEAMNAHLPIVATNVGGNPEVVLHNQTGLLAPRRDATALGNHLNTLFTNPPLREKLAAAGNARLRTHFTQDRMHAAYRAHYDAMLPPTTPAPAPATSPPISLGQSQDRRAA